MATSDTTLGRLPGLESARLVPLAEHGAGLRTDLKRRDLRLTPISIREADAFVDAHHRHHRSLNGKQSLFAVAVAKGDEVRGVAVIGLPAARELMDGYTAEVRRVAVLEGTPNGCSMLYAASWRAARALGYKRLLTYTLETEPGTSLKAAGWRFVGTAGGGSWDRPGRPRVDKHPTLGKIRWEAL